MKLARKFLVKMTLFDLFLVLLFLSGVIFFILVTFRETSKIVVTVKVGQDDIRKTDDGLNELFSQLFYPGMVEKDGSGKTQAEVIKVLTYEYFPNHRAVYLTLKLKALYTKSTNKYAFKGRPLLIGYPIKLELDHLNVDGMVTNIEGVKDPRKKVSLLVEAQIWNESLTFTETSGIKPYIAEAIKAGDEVMDSNGKVIVNVISKKVSDAKRLVTTADGQTVIRTNPFLKDVNLVLRIEANEINNKYYFLDDIPVRIGQAIPINFSYISIFPEITKITPLE